MNTVADLDLERFMGDWYVVANIPTFLEREAHNAVESYELKPGNRVATTFRFRKGAFDGPLKVYEPTGYVDPEDNAVWGMQFVWPIKAEFLVVYVDEDYQRTIIGRSKRDYVWLMARTPQLSDDEYAEMVAAVAAAGYDTQKLRRVPQRWPE
jgi:apolipoprotein D and lipocalin family protein